MPTQQSPQTKHEALGWNSRVVVTLMRESLEIVIAHV